MAMKICGVHRLVYMSFMGVKDKQEPGRRGGEIYRTNYTVPRRCRGHETREKIIIESDLGWTIVRPPTLTNGKHLGKYRSGENIQSKSFAATISRADVADFMLSQLKSINICSVNQL